VSVDFIDPPDEALPARDAPIRFTAPSTSFVAVRFPGSAEPGAEPETIAYRDETFHPDYATSTRDDDTISLRRVGGWPRTPTLIIGDAGAAASQLQPLTDLPHIVAAYALNAEGGNPNVDRSGKGRDFGGVAPPNRLPHWPSGMAKIPDLIPGQLAALSTNYVTSDPTRPDRIAMHFDDVWGLFGAVTVIHRVYPLAYDFEERCFGQLQGTTPGVVSVALQWGMIGQPPSSRNCLYYYAETSAKAGIVFISNIQVEPWKWHFVCVRRRPDHSVRLALGTGPNPETMVFAESGAQAAVGQQAGSPRYLTLGGHQDDTCHMNTAMADLVIWDRYLSDDEVRAQYVPMMKGAS
jgi:hypothetical protein